MIGNWQHWYWQHFHIFTISKLAPLQTQYKYDTLPSEHKKGECIMTTSTLQIRVDSDLRREADALFASAGLDLTSAVRLFLRQTVIRRRLPFEVLSESPDPFWSETNQRVLRESIESFERGEAKRHELIEA